MRHLDRIALEPGGSLRPWLHRIVINLAYDWVARRKRSAGPIELVVEKLATSPGLSPERVAERHEQDGIVAEAVAALPFKQRIVVILFYLHDMELNEIAEVLNLPEGTVKSRLYYARANLRARLESDARLARPAVLAYASTQPPVA
jgi:RNA polymerase sigma-70 factor (ECF subfamily)